MSTIWGAVAPRDRATAARTLVGAALFSLVATTGWEVTALLTERITSTPASAGRAVGLAVLVVLLARVCALAPDRVPLWIYPCVAVVAPAMTVVVAVGSQDGSAAGQLGLVYPVIYAAAHFRRTFAWAVTGIASGAAALIAFSTLAPASASADVVVIVPALAMITVVLLGLAEHQERLLARLGGLAAADSLTGLATRRELEAVARRTLQPSPDGRERRQGDHPEACGLLLIDLDNFKDLNDRFGHPAGDAALVHVAQLVRSSVRAADTVARLGGDELAVLLTGSPAEVDARARAIRERVAGTALPAVDDLRLTVSIGVAHGHVGTSTFESLYARADRALYRAKAAGRNGVSTAPCAAG